MPKTSEVQLPREGEKCPTCGEGTLGVSPSGHHLMCHKCGRVVIPETEARTLSKN